MAVTTTPRATLRTGRRSRRPRRRPLDSLLVGLLAGLLVGCGVGSGTLGIDAAEAAVLGAAEAVVAALALDVPRPLRAGAREPCQLRTGEAGLRTRVTVRADLDLPAADAFERAAAALSAADLLIVTSGVPDTLLASREGMSVTVAVVAGRVELDGLTGCRPR